MSTPDLSRSRRFLFDVQACQTAGSAHRGVGRYSSALTEYVGKRSDGIDLRLLVTAALPIPDSYFAFQRHRCTQMPELPQWETPAGYIGGEREALDALAYQSVANALNADLLHVSHVFEGWSERVALPDFSLKAPGQVYSATLYDLIPLRFPEFYFQNAQFKRWYLSRLEWLRRADHLLAISDASRTDAIDLLGIAPERITTIHGGVGAQFQASVGTGNAFVANQLRERYGIAGRYVLYTGGDDYRKNIEGALRGFAQLRGDVRRALQFVVVCSMDDGRKDMYRAIGRQAGLAADEMVFTGYVPEHDLVALYQQCALFIFPSLYEGLGLPVLEAMRCGAAVIGSNTSSIAELIALPAATFNPSDPVDIGRCMHQVLTDDQFGRALRSHGLARSSDFSWERSAQLAVDALSDCSDRLNRAGTQVALSGWLPRRRLAMFTPLPPCRSGIADYNAQFLPFLARHFDIDLYVDGYVVEDDAISATYRIFDARDFPPVAEAYDVILYEFGNSEFHEHMLSLAQRFPGVIGLHDAYLSGLMGYLDFHKGEAGRFASEMLAAHGPLARHFFAPVQACKDANTASIVNLPCIKSVLDSAIGIISHSPFNLHLANKFHPEGWWAPFRSIPQMVVRPELLSTEKRNGIRRELGFADGDIVITTFGHVAWTKWGDRLVAAFAATAALRGNPRIHLVFAGELAADPFGHELKKSIKQLGVGKRIRITGYLSAEDYVRYLRATDVAIQLRTKSRGGAPKGVLDCLAYGVPVVVNNDASYRDYPGNSVIKLSPDPALQEIADALSVLAADGLRRETASRGGLAYVRDAHDPVLCAAKYAAAIEEFRIRRLNATRSRLVSGFAPHLGGLADVGSGVAQATAWLDQRRIPQFKRRRLLIDVSHIVRQDHQTGIPRVVKQVVRHLYCSAVAGFEPIAVELVDGRLVRATQWLVTQGVLMAQEQNVGADGVNDFSCEDTLLMLDSSWARYAEFFGVFDALKRVGGRVITAVYDLLPITLPPGNIVDGGKAWFEGWLTDAVKHSDGLICISGAVASDLNDWMARNHTRFDPTHHPFVRHWHLGSDFAAMIDERVPSKSVTVLGKQPYLLMVGTIEPRKSHAAALDAFEQLWKQGETLALCIVGKEGWMVSDLLLRLRSHVELGKRLFLFEDSTDADMAELYRGASGLLFLSKGEGFGLPLIEAAQFGTPIVCSDLPVFHEIAGDFAHYVSLGEPDKLASELQGWASMLRSGQVRRTEAMPRLSWRDSAHALLRATDIVPDVSALTDDYA